MSKYIIYQIKIIDFDGKSAIINVEQVTSNK